MAEELEQFANELEQAEDFDAALHQLVCREFTNHQRIIFDGNGYSDAWKEEAMCRGLSNLPSTADALASFITRKNIELFTKHGIFTEAEYRARHEIHLEAYTKILNIEALTSIDMIRHQILPAALRYCGDLSRNIQAKQSIGASCKAETHLVNRLSAACDSLYENCERLSFNLQHIPADHSKAAQYYREVIVKDMDAARKDADLLETLTDKSYWPYPTYSDLLFY